MRVIVIASLIIALLTPGVSIAEFSRREFSVGKVERNGTSIALKVVRYSSNGEPNFEVHLDYTDGMKHVQDNACFDVVGWNVFKQGVQAARTRADRLEDDEMVMLDHPLALSVSPDRGAMMKFACADAYGQRAVILVFAHPYTGRVRTQAALFIDWPDLGSYSYGGMVDLIQATDRALSKIGALRSTRI